MTNFEKWKQELTLEQFISFRNNGCPECPTDNCDCYECGLVCDKMFREWGSAECKESAK